jgi:small-conductance mechanosensitive channel
MLCTKFVVVGEFVSEPGMENSESFYAAAVTRIPRFMIFLGLVFAPVAWLRFGWRVALGFICGCAVAYLNFHWLEHVVTALADRVTRTGQAQSGRGVVLRFLLRYLLMALAAYAIFSVSPASLYGLFAGLFLPVAGIACEAAYEIYAAYARGL